ncbi:MAG: STAS domain-containing protein [Chloroflexi bacterium]|nr:STAS domain-containing protein [Chloroflexota bacterium]MBI3170270.1 STAS domain-containing protein [Chloroflexota bacterium]
MEINITKGNVDIIAVSGSIDALTSSELVKTLNDHIHDGHPNVIVDFGKVEFMSSAGLRAILASVKEARAAGGDFRLASPQPGIDKVLKMAGFYNIVKIYPTVEEALASFG